MELSPGTTASAELTVGPADLADSLALDAHDSFPKVLATARMIALMETAASRAMQGVLDEGQMSVGIAVNVTHSAPTALGDGVIAMARFTGMEDDRYYLFEVSAHDSAGEIGKGTHKRAVITAERLIEKAAKRKKPVR